MSRIVICKFLIIILFVVFSYTLPGSTGEIVPYTDSIQLPIHKYEKEPTDTLEHVLSYRADVDPLNIASSIIFALAIIHTLFARRIQEIAHKLERQHADSDIPGKSFWTELLFFLGEVEVIMGIWVIPLLLTITLRYNWETAISYLNSRDYTEAIAIVVILTLASTSPIMNLAESMIKSVVKLLGESPASWWMVLLTIGPLFGSFITEAGAMIVTGLLISKHVYSKGISSRLAYGTLGLLFTNVSLGGVFTTWASPPALLVAERWGWDTPMMFQTFGWKSFLAIVISNTLYYLYFKDELRGLASKKVTVKKKSLHTPAKTPLWVTGMHVIFLAAIVAHLREPVIFIGIFLLFLGFYQATANFQSPIMLRAPLLVGFFFAGLEIHGGLQEWWIAPLLQHAGPLTMMGITAVLGPILDNAMLAYLATFIPDITRAAQYSVIVGALSTGGMTVMGNAPNPAGLQILSPHFKEGISPKYLFYSAFIPAIIALTVFVIFRV